MHAMQNCKKRRSFSDKQPRVWVKSFGRKDRGRPLFRAQSIWSALADLKSNPSIGSACVMIPGKAPNDITLADDISTIGRQHGVIVTKTASISKDALNVTLLVIEKLNVLDDARQKVPNLLLEVLKTQDTAKFKYLAGKLRGCRNGLAHPDPDRITKGNINLSGIPDECKEYARLLLAWNASPYIHKVEKARSNDFKNEE